MKKRILFSGASSFTGYWIVKELVEHGYEVVVFFNKFESNSDGLRKFRISNLKKITESYDNIDYSSDDFFNLLDSVKNIDIFCHHFFYTINYKDKNYDIMKGILNSVGDIQRLFLKLKKINCKNFILTGTSFEEEEGNGDDYLYAFSPYGLAKTLTSKIFSYYCRWNEINFSKFVIPNPFGPFEEYKFTSYLADNWINNMIPEINSPDYIRDNIPSDLLAKSYVYLINTILIKNEPIKLSPSGFVESNKDFTKRLAYELSKRLNIKCEFKINKQREYLEPLIRYNTDNMLDFFKDYKIEKFWDELADFYLKRFKTKEL